MLGGFFWAEVTHAPSPRGHDAERQPSQAAMSLYRRISGFVPVLIGGAMLVHGVIG
jgi:hypothetical protein